MFGLMLQMGFVLCLTPFMLLNQSVIQQREQRQVEQVAQMLLVRHQAVQQYCAAQRDSSGHCGFIGSTRREIPLATLQPYLAESLLSSPLLQDGRGAVRSKFDGSLVLSYIDPARLGTRKGERLLGEVQSAWLRLSSVKVCADIFHRPRRGRPGSILCADGGILNVDSSLPDGAPVVADP
jgi:hypothetical protein